MINPDELFSRAALDKMRSPEKLDTLLHITNPIGWMALISVMILLFGVFAWSVFGSFSVKADGAGLILDAGGIHRYVAEVNGRVDALYITKGQYVEQGKIIGHIYKPDSSAEMDMARHNIGLANSQTDVLQRANQYDAKRNVAKMAENMISPYEGIVNAIMIKEGSLVSVGDEICSIRSTQQHDELIGVLYVPATMGKRIEKGMSVQLSPSKEYANKTGSLLGIVRSVSQYPVTQSEIMNRLGNAQLVQSIMHLGNGAVLEVAFDLVKNEEDESGYLWTSVVGKHRPITAGTYVTGSVVVERMPPIAKVFYNVSQWLRNR